MALDEIDIGFVKRLPAASHQAHAAHAASPADAMAVPSCIRHLEQLRENRLQSKELETAIVDDVVERMAQLHLDLNALADLSAIPERASQARQAAEQLSKFGSLIHKPELKAPGAL